MAVKGVGPADGDADAGADGGGEGAPNPVDGEQPASTNAVAAAIHRNRANVPSSIGARLRVRA
jgi:hypothetical protein